MWVLSSPFVASLNTLYVSSTVSHMGHKNLEKQHMFTKEHNSIDFGEISPILFIR